MKSPRLILVLILGGLGLLFAGFTRMDLNNQAGTISAPASASASWLTGLAGAAMLCAGLYVARAAYLSKGKAAVAGNPGRQRTLVVLGLVGALAVAGLLVVVTRHGNSSTPASASGRPESAGTASTHVALSGADQQLSAKLQLVISCVNETFPHYEDIVRPYRAEVASLSQNNAPLEFGARPLGGYFHVGEIGSTGDPAKECADGLERAISLPPAIGDLDAAAKDAASALRDIAAPGRDMDLYLQQKAYLDDRFSKGRQLDSTIAPLLNRIVSASAQLRAAAIRENHTLRVRELDTVAKSEGRTIRWHVLNTMLASRESNDRLLGAFRSKQLDRTVVANALQPLQSAFDQALAYSGSHPETRAPGEVWSLIERPLGSQLADIKELREAIAAPAGNDSDQQQKLRDLLKSESSDFNNAVEMYNTGVRY